jgi:hypothetical protein
MSAATHRKKPAGMTSNPAYFIRFPFQASDRWNPALQTSVWERIRNAWVMGLKTTGSNVFMNSKCWFSERRIAGGDTVMGITGRGRPQPEDAGHGRA